MTISSRAPPNLENCPSPNDRPAHFGKFYTERKRSLPGSRQDRRGNEGKDSRWKIRVWVLRDAHKYINIPWTRSRVVLVERGMARTYISEIEDTLRVLAACSPTPASGSGRGASVACKTPDQSHDCPISSRFLPVFSYADVHARAIQLTN